MDGIKTCGHCKAQKNRTAFCISRSTKDGLKSQCRECIKATYIANKANVALRHHKYREANKEKLKAYHRQYNRENQQKISEKNKACYQANQQQYKKKAHEWSVSNKSRVSELLKAWRESNPERLNVIQNRWKKKNPEAVKAAGHRRRARKKAVGGTHNKDDIKNIYKMQRGKCAYCRDDVGQDYHLDHIVALAKGGSNDKRNLQILCPPCNRSKNDKDPIDFMRSRGFLL